MIESKLEYYWNDLPIGKENAVGYDYLTAIWDTSPREVRRILHEVSLYDNGDDFVLIRSGRNKGFYKTDDMSEIEAFKAECLRKGRSVFAPVQKINRVLKADGAQFSFENNLRAVREMRGLLQKDVCLYMTQHGAPLDTSLLSKMENGVCLPTPIQLGMLAILYEFSPLELIRRLDHAE